MDVEMFDRAVQATGGVVTAVSTDRLDRNTRCTEWSVRDLLNHLIGQYEAVATGPTGMLEPKGNFPRGAHFAPPIEVPEDAPIQDKLLAYLGRQP